MEYIRKEVKGQGVASFSQSVANAFSLGLVTEAFHRVVQYNARKLDNAIDTAKDREFEYWGLRSVYDMKLLRNPNTGLVIESPQHWFLRTLLLLSSASIKDALVAYKTPEDAEVPEALKLQPTAPVDALVASTGTDTFFVRPLMPGMGQAVAERPILRKDADGRWETWGDVAQRVAHGNSLLADTPNHPASSEYSLLRKHLAKATTLMSGRHLQHGDAEQPKRLMEVFSNCSTAVTSFLSFYLLLNGSGVGRCYDDDMILIDWDNAPNIRCVLDSSHPDFVWGTHETLRDAKHKYGFGTNVIWFEVPDSREGWGKAVELWETLAFEKIHANKLLILDFSKIRAKGSPIGGMQNRPASGPTPLMNAFMSSAALKGAGVPRWKQAMYVDHYFAECVLVGGARRAARMATKFWKDRSVLEFITVKRPMEYYGKTVDEILQIRKESQFPPQSFLWSSNNSVAVDQEFWDLVVSTTPVSKQTEDEIHAKRVFEISTAASYGDGTGEPGFINVHKLVQKDKGLAEMLKTEFVGSPKYRLNEDTHLLITRLAKKAKAKTYHMVVNPCGEIVLFLAGAFCVIADFVPYHCDTFEEMEEGVRAVVRALKLTRSLDYPELELINNLGENSHATGRARPPQLDPHRS